MNNFRIRKIRFIERNDLKANHKKHFLIIHKFL